MAEIKLTQEIAEIVKTKLNDLALTMYEASEISTKFVFDGTSDFTQYERFITGEYDMDIYEKTTPFIISSVSGGQQPEDYTRYDEQFRVNFYGYISEKQDFEKVIRKYINNENTSNRVISLEGYRVEKKTGFITIEPEIMPALDGTNEARFNADFEFVWNFAEGIVTSDDITITLDGISIPYNMISFVPEKRHINTQATTSDGIDKFMASVTGYTMTLALPYLESNTKLVELFKDIWNKKYNKKYLLHIDIGTEVTFEDYVYISAGNFVDPKPSILDFEVMIRRVPKQTEIYIDEQLVPVLDFGFKNKAALNATIKLNEESAKAAYLSANYGITMTLPLDEDDSNPTIAGLFSDVLDSSFYKSHTIRLKRNTKDITYDVIMVDGDYNFEQDSNGSILLLFVEEDKDGE